MNNNSSINFYILDERFKLNNINNLNFYNSDLKRFKRHNIYKLIFFFIICILFYCASICYHKIFITINKKSEDKTINLNYKSIIKNELIKENFFVYDSNNLENIKPHMYGFSISEDGILTDNYYKQLGYYYNPKPQGVYVLIRKNKNQIEINQDFHGNYGIYIYENKNKNYFAFSNSFLLLEKYLIGKQKISLNKEFADNFVVSRLCTPSVYETMIKEITKIPSNTIVIINTQNKKFKISYIDYKENTIPFESKEGLIIIDKWIDKWGYIIRSLLNKSNNVASDLSGGFDSRVVLSIILSSGINLNNIIIKSAEDKKFSHEEDFKIASNISLRFGFKLNNKKLDINGTQWSPNDSLFCTIFSKLGFHKEFYLKDKFYDKPRFVFTGGGSVRGYPGLPIRKYIEEISYSGKKFGKKFYISSKKLCNRSIDKLKKEKSYYSDYEISTDFYDKGRSVNHDGKAALEAFIANAYLIQPLIDPDIKKIKFNVNGESTHDLISYIYVRFAYDLINFPIQGNRTLNLYSIKKAKSLNSLMRPYKIKNDYNKNFYIDILRKSPVPYSSIANKDINLFLKELFESSKFIKTINKLYDNNIYRWAKVYTIKSNYFPMRYIYGLFSIEIILDDLSLNERYIKNKKKTNKFKRKC